MSNACQTLGHSRGRPAACKWNVRRGLYTNLHLGNPAGIDEGGIPMQKLKTLMIRAAVLAAPLSLLLIEAAPFRRA